MGPYVHKRYRSDAKSYKDNKQPMKGPRDGPEKPPMSRRTAKGYDRHHATDDLTTNHQEEDPEDLQRSQRATKEYV